MSGIERRWLRLKEGAAYYGLSLNAFRKLVDKAHAAYKVGKAVLVDINAVDTYIKLVDKS